MRKDSESAFSRSSHGNLRRVSRCIVLQEQNASSQFSSPLSCNLSGKTVKYYIFALYKMVSYHAEKLSQRTFYQVAKAMYLNGKLIVRIYVM